MPYLIHNMTLRDPRQQLQRLILVLFLKIMSFLTMIKPFSKFLVDRFFKSFILNKLSKCQSDNCFRPEYKHLVIWRNQQAYTNCEIKLFVPKTSSSYLNHILYWYVTVLLWCSNVKLEIYIRRSTYITAFNNLFKWNRSFNACLLPLFCRYLLLDLSICLLETS